jgi:phage shock protein C
MLARVDVSANRMRRPTAGRRVAGLCLGFAERYGYDVATVRIVWTFLTLITGVIPGMVTYALAWAFVPSDGEPL